MGTISDYMHLKVKLKEKNYLHVNSTAQGCPNKINKTFLIEDFHHVPPDVDTGLQKIPANF
jgi:hypothetical protein